MRSYDLVRFGWIAFAISLMRSVEFMVRNRLGKLYFNKFLWWKMRSGKSNNINPSC